MVTMTMMATMMAVRLSGVIKIKAIFKPFISLYKCTFCVYGYIMMYLKREVKHICMYIVYIYIHKCYCVYVHTYIRTYVRAYIYTDIQTDSQTDRQTYIQNYIHTDTHTHTHIHTSTHTHTCMSKKFAEVEFGRRRDTTKNKFDMTSDMTI